MMLIDGNKFHVDRKQQVARPYENKSKLTLETVKNKYQRRRVKLRLQGRCEHCGQPCAPYMDCEVRRKNKAESRLKKRCEKLGIPWDVFNQLREEVSWQKKAKKLLKTATAIINYRESQSSPSGESEQVATSQT